MSYVIVSISIILVVNIQCSHVQRYKCMRLMHFRTQLNVILRRHGLRKRAAVCLLKTCSLSVECVISTRQFLLIKNIPNRLKAIVMCTCILKDYFNFLSSDFSQTNKVWSVMLFSTPLAKATRVSCAENRSKPIAICRPMLRFVTCLYIAPCS